MSNMPLVPPILPLPDDATNDPQPESENAEAEKARGAREIEEGGNLLDPRDAPRNAGEGVHDDGVEEDIEAAKRRQAH